MARPPQYERKSDDAEEPYFVAVRNDAKRLSPGDRAKLLAWLCLYYDDAGERWGTTIKRRRIAFDREEFWIVKIPTKKGKR